MTDKHPSDDGSAEPERDEQMLETADSTEPIEVSENDDAEADEASERYEHSGPEPKLERLQKILAQAGVASRRHAEELITGGRVQVNGQIVTTLGTKADAGRDHIRVDGKLLQGAERLRYFMLNKPKGFVTTVSDPEGRPTVMEFFTKMGERLYPVGRLDYLSEGLLLVTNDGELANGLTRAAAGVEKTYLVKVAGQPTEGALEQLREGVVIARGSTNPAAPPIRKNSEKVKTAPARIRQIRKGENPWFEVVLIEGRNRELRKMFEEIGHHVEKIRRVGYGPLALDVEPGKVRELDPGEVQALRLTVAGKLKPRRLKTTLMLPKEAGLSTEAREQKRAAKSGRPYRPRDDRGARPGWQRSEGEPTGPKFTPTSPEARRPEFRSSDSRRTGTPRFERPQMERPRRDDASPREDFRPRRDTRTSGSVRPRFDRPARSAAGSRPPSSAPRFGKGVEGSRRETGGRPAFGGGSRPASGHRPGFGARPKFGAKPDFSSRPSDRPARRIEIEEDSGPRANFGGESGPKPGARPGAKFSPRPGAKFGSKPGFGAGGAKLGARPGGASRSGARPPAGAKPGGFKPRPGGFKPRADGEGHKPKPGGSNSKPGGFKSKPGGFKPKAGGFKSKPGGFKPKAGGFKAKPGSGPTRGGKPGGSKPKSGGFKPRPGGFKPRSGGKPRGGKRG